MGVATLVLVVNPGSASRKYALYANGRLRAQLHFEHVHDHVVCTFTTPKQSIEVPTELADVSGAAEHVIPLLTEHGALGRDETVFRIGLRIVAPGMYFLDDHLVDDEVVAKLKHAQDRAPLHISATLSELHKLRAHFPDTPIIGVSDSTFHKTKPDEAWNYGIRLQDADHFDIKRFGYHGISVSAAVRILQSVHKLPKRLLVCHIGSGISVTAVLDGKSFDNTMGFSPLEGVVMGTRSGNIDPSALIVLKDVLHMDELQAETYLNTQCGLLGLSGISADVRDLLDAEAAGSHEAYLALATYVYALRKAIGQMAAALGGIDALVFTGTVGERSAIIRNRLMKPLEFLGLQLDTRVNKQCTNPSTTVRISKPDVSLPIYVVPTDEAAAIAHHTITYGV